MPQLASETFASQIFWVLLGFALVYFFVGSVAFPGLQEIMRSRAAHIESLLKSAETVRREVDDIERELRNALETAQMEATRKESQLMSDFLERSRKQKAAFSERMKRESKERSKALEEIVAAAFREVLKSSDDFVAQALQAMCGSGANGN